MFFVVLQSYSICWEVIAPCDGYIGVIVMLLHYPNLECRLHEMWWCCVAVSLSLLLAGLNMGHSFHLFVSQGLGRPGDGKKGVLGEPKEMITPVLRKNLEKQGYKLIGSHSGVKLCRWTKVGICSYVQASHATWRSGEIWEKNASNQVKKSGNLIGPRDSVACLLWIHSKILPYLF